MTNLTEETSPAAVAEAVQALASEAKSPDPWEGRGIVCCAGGERYGLNAYVMIRMLRHHGCNLPVQVWHLGAREIVRPIFDRIADLGNVEFVDAREVGKHTAHPRLNGWEAKVHAILHCQWREVMLIDADNVPCYDPSILFDSRDFARCGAIFWPDQGVISEHDPAWKIFGIEKGRRERELETGQILVDKRRCRLPLLLADWYCRHSEFFFRFVHGDKEVFHLAWRRTGFEYASPSRSPKNFGKGLYQFDFDGFRVFQHRNQCKWEIAGNKPIPGFQFDDLCLKWIDEFRQSIGRNTQWEKMAAGDRAIADGLAGKWFEYCRIGHDQREMRLGDDGIVSDGAGRLEACWHVREEKLVITDIGGEATVRLAQDHRGVWCGRWLHHERMRIRLIPLRDGHPAAAPVESV